MPARFLQFHFLTSYPATLLNRDDAGFAKRLPFGGSTRTRISSQCLKRHWRSHKGEHSLEDLGEKSIRSRRTFEKRLYRPLVDEDGMDPDLAQKVTQEIMKLVLGQSAKAQKASKDEDKGKALHTGQVTVFGPAELNYLRDVARKVCEAGTDPKKIAKTLKAELGREGRKNLKAMAHAAGLDAAMFGRMVTSDILARGDAAVHVAHAFTVHAESTESDYFSAVDDLMSREDEASELGSGHIGSVELTSGLYYGYLVVDVPLLVANLEGANRKDWLQQDRDLAARVVESLVNLVAVVTPGAKLGSTAPYSNAHMVMVEAGDSQPRTLANAFMQPVPERPDLVANTYQRLGEFVKQLDEAYGGPERRFLAIGTGDAVAPLEDTGERERSLADLARWAASRVEEG